MNRPDEAFINMENAIDKVVDEMSKERFLSSTKYLFDEIISHGRKIQVQIVITNDIDDFTFSEPIYKPLDQKKEID